MPLAGAFAPTCRFGNREVSASAVGGTSLRCSSPPAALAPGHARVILLQHNASEPPVEWLHGHAHLPPGGGILQLTTGEAGSAGSLVLPVAALNGTAGDAPNCRWCDGPRRQVFAHFRARFEMRAHLGTGGDGLSFSYGRLPEQGKVGEKGAGLGLRVAFLTAARCAPPRQTSTCPVVEARYATRLLRSVPLAPSFRDAAFASVLIEYTDGGLRVVHGGHEYIGGDSGGGASSPLVIDGWAPSEEWSFGFGARSGSQTDVHELRRVELELGALVGGATAVALGVSLNGQQFAPVAVGHADDQYPRAGFAYFGSPNVTTLSPTTGPIDGGSPALMLAGTGRHEYGGLGGGSHYRCRFGAASPYEYSPATRGGGALDEVYCVAPAGAVQSDVPVALALNGQQYFAPPTTYDRYDTRGAAAEAFASPNSGPVLGATTVTIALPSGSGRSLGGGDDYRCRFHPLPAANDTRPRVYEEVAAGLITAATYFADSATVVCPSPPAAAPASHAAVANVSLQLSINGMHFDEVGPFEYYEAATSGRVSVLSPSSGPHAGGTQLLLVGTGFEVGSHANCWLGSGRADATAQAGGSQLRCVSPAAPLGSAAAFNTTLRVALNAQQASDSAPFTFYPTPTPTLALPDNGHAAAAAPNTLVSVFTDSAADANNATFADGTHLRCRFGASGAPVTEASLVAPAHIRCRAPLAQPSGGVDLQIALNGQQYGPSVRFDLLPAPIISEIHPASAPFAGGAMVYLNGAHFANRSQAGGRGACRFGTSLATVPATFVHSGRVVCRAPPATTPR